MSKYNVGDRVVLLGVPKYLVHDLPKDEQKEILSFVGKCAVVTEVDKNGYNWIGFGETHNHDHDYDVYSGHSFAIEDEYLDLASATN